MTPFPNACSPFSVINFKNLEFSHGEDGRGPKTTFSIADTADSSVAVSGDLMEYFGSGIFDKSIRPILSPHFTGLYNNFSCRRYGDGAPNLVSFP